MEEYSIGEIAKHFNVSTDTLRLYDKKGIVCPERKKNGYRYYSRNKMIALAYVMFLRKAELSLEQIRIILNANLELILDQNEGGMYFHSVSEELTPLALTIHNEKSFVDTKDKWYWQQ